MARANHTGIRIGMPRTNLPKVVLHVFETPQVCWHESAQRLELSDRAYSWTAQLSADGS